MLDYLIIIPAFNEEKNLGRVIFGIKETGAAADILVVNDGSNDRTETVAAENGVNVLSHPFNLGYGAAIQTGFKFATIMGYKYVIQFDADGQHDPCDIPLIIEALKEGNTDIVIGSRFLGRGSFEFGILKITAIKFFRFLIKYLARTVITDPTSGLKGLSRSIFCYYSKIGNYPVDFPDADILIQLIRRKYRVREFAANMKPRLSGESMHSGIKPLYYFVKVILSICIIVLREKFAGEAFEKNG